MFVYFDNQGTLKEIVNDSAIRQGNYGVDKIYFFIEGGEIVDGVYKALEFAAGRRTFTDVSGNTLTTESFSLTTVTQEIPFDKKRELKWFKYWTNYEFFVIDLSSEVLVNHGTVGCRIEMIENDTMSVVELTEEDILTAHPSLTLGWLLFTVEQTATGSIIEPDTAINIAQWNYLIHNMVTMADLDAAVSGKQDELVSGVNIKTINGESILGSGDLEIESGLVVPVMQPSTVEVNIEEPSVIIEFTQTQIDEILENRYPLLSIIYEDGDTQLLFRRVYSDGDIEGNAVSYTCDLPTGENKVYVFSFEISPETAPETNTAGVELIESASDLNLAEVAYTGNYDDLNGKPDIPTHTSQLDNDSGFITGSAIPDIATELTPSSTNNETVGAQCAYDAIQNVREVAEGKCKTYILNDYAPIITTDAEARKYRKADGTYFDDLADFNDYIGSNNPTCINNLFNSQNAAISVFEMELYDYYLVESDTKTVYSSYAGGVGGNDFWKFNKGDEFLVIETNVPDRWFSVQSGSGGGGILLPDSFVFHVLETKTQDLSNYAQKSDVSALQATATVVKDALTNINGRVLSAYEATAGFDQDYVWYTITYGGQPVTEEQAINYMEYMTGSRFLPIYNYEKPQNCVFIFGDRSVWKPQYDAVNGLRLYRISTSLAAEDTNNEFTGNNTFNGSLGGRLIATYNEFSLTNNGSGIWLSDALYLKHAEINMQGNVVINGPYAAPDVGLHFYDQPMGHAYYFNINDNDETLDIVVNNGIGTQATNVTVASIDGGSSKLYFYKTIFVQDLICNGGCDIGDAQHTWSNLYLSGNLTDGTNSVSIANIVTTNTPQRISASKSFFNNVSNDTLPLRIQGFENKTWGLEMDKDFGRLHFKFADVSGTNISNVIDHLVLDSSALYPAQNSGKDLGTSSYTWKDLYLSGGVKFSRSDTPTTWSLQEISGGTLQLYRDNLGKILFTSTYFQTYSHIPTATNAYDLGSSSYYWKDLYLSGSIDFKDGTGTSNRTWRIKEGQWGTIEFETAGNGGSYNGRFSFQTSAFCPTVANTVDLGTNNVNQMWKDLYLTGSIKDNQGNAVTVEQLYYLGKAIQGLAQPNTVNLSNGDTLTDQPTIYMMSQHLPVMINNGMCYFLTEDTNYYVYTTHTFDSSTLDVVPYKVIVNKSTFVVTIARI